MAGHDFNSLAARKYIEERNQKRSMLIDIAEHRPFSSMDAGDHLFRGLREVDGERLALFEKEKQILVLPIDQVTAARLKRLHLGDPVSVTAAGRIQVKGGKKFSVRV